MVEHIRLIEKGSKVMIIEIEDCYGMKLPEIELTLGNEILKSDDDYVNYNGSMIVSEDEIKDAVGDYMKYEYPEIKDYMLDIEE
jgi:hypothetical protein